MSTELKPAEEAMKAVRVSMMSIDHYNMTESVFKVWIEELQAENKELKNLIHRWASIHQDDCRAEYKDICKQMVDISIDIDKENG